MLSQTNEELITIIEKLLRLYSEVLYEYDVATKKINFIVKDEHVLQKNITIDSLLDFIAKTYDLMNAEKDKIFEALEKINQINSSHFSINIDCLTNSANKCDLNIKGINRNGKVLCAVNNTTMPLNADEAPIEVMDNLTKTLNGPSIVSAIKKEFDNPTSNFILIQVNIDNFNNINANYGYNFGDIILVEVASEIKKAVANNGLVGHLNGDNFLALIHCNTDYETIWKICSTLKNEIAKISDSNSKNVPITATVACTVYPDHGTTFEDHMNKLNRAMTRGKNKGKNKFIIFTNKCTDIDYNYSHKKDGVQQSDNKDPQMHVVSSMFDMMNRYLPISKNLMDSIDLVGSFFLPDRINIIILNENHNDIDKIINWINPEYPELKPITKTSIEAINLFTNCVNGDGYFSTTNVPKDESNSKYESLYKILRKYDVKATLIHELRNTNNDLIGTIHFEYCHSYHIWQSSELHYLILISKIYASAINKYLMDKQLEKKFYTDELTGLYNQSKFISTCNEFLVENKTPASLIFFNISHFQYINEQYGFEEGNKILIHFADLLRKELSNDSIFCRISADKFLALVKTQDKKQITDIFYSMASQLRLAKNDKFVRKVSLIGGVYFIKEKETIYRAIDLANLAARTISQSEKSNIVFYEEKYHEEITLQKDIEEHMFVALKNHEFVIYYQPKVDIKTEQIIGAEALTRWNFKNERLLQPYQFIELFEKNGFIVELDFYVFEEVCKFIAKLLSEGKRVYPISINMSRYQFNFNQYIERIEVIRKKYNISPEYIEIEITEGLMSNTEVIADLIKRLHDIGYKVSMDDFGSGYSNLASLSSLDFDTIKLDKGFCSDSYNPKENIIISNVIKMAYELNINILCEGVETKSQAQNLYDLGCNQAQGWLYDKALAESDFIKKYLN